ncbi:MAG: hypothetical protein JXL80_05620 [Planctomycetes bacterium]|nr:hypothetical protein [Planctomycetota bacterium]
MRTMTTRCLLVALALLTAAASPALAGPRDRDDNDVDSSRLKVSGMLAEARKLGQEAGLLTREAIEGRIPDRTKPAGEGNREDRWIELTDKERLLRFSDAKKKFDASFRKVGEVEEFLKSHPDIVRENIPAEAKKKLQEACARTLVAEARFRMSKDLGTAAQWQKLIEQALKLDPDSTEAKRAQEELAEKVKEKAEKKDDSDKSDNDSKKDEDEKE